MDPARRTATVIVSRQVLPGRDGEAERWVQRMRRTVQRAPGYVGATFHPPQDAHPGEWLIVYSFDSVGHLDAWLASPDRQGLLELGASCFAPGLREQRVADAPEQETVTLVSSVRLRPGVEEEHRARHEAAVDAARRHGGLMRAELLPAVPGVQPETVALLTFAGQAELDAWVASDERRALLADMADLVEGDRTVNVVGGFAGWFAGSAAAPRRWKQATAVVAGLVPVSLAFTVARTELAPDLPLVPAVVLSTVANVVVLTWVVMPRLTRALAGWLAR